MQQAVPVGQGAMAAILGLDAAAVIDGCAQAAAATGEVVSAANFNDPKQTVISGSQAGVAKACELLMQPAADALRTRLVDVALNSPRLPVVNNIDVAAPTAPDAIRDALYRQASGPVRWVELVQALKALGATHIVECGPGKVLAGMVKRIDADLVSGAIFDPASLRDTLGLLA